MGLFDKTKHPRKPRTPRESGDDAPLLLVQRRPRKRNIWNDDDDEQDAELGSLRQRSSETFNRFTEGEDEEDIARMSTENGGYRDSEDNGQAKTSIDDPQSVSPRKKNSNLSLYCDRALQNRYCSIILLHQILTQMNRNYSKTIPHTRKSEPRSRIQMIQR